MVGKIKGILRDRTIWYIYFSLLVFISFISLLIVSTDLTILGSEEFANNINKIPWDRIFLHNLLIVTFLIGGGILTFGIVTVIIFAVNMFSILLAISGVYLSTGNIIVAVFILLIHGFFELFAISLAANISLISAKYLYCRFKGKIFYFNIKRIFLQVVLVVIILLIAALVESYITPFVIKVFL